MSIAASAVADGGRAARAPRRSSYLDDFRARWPSVTAPIASATSLQQLQDIVKSAELKLSTQDIEELNAASG